MDYTDLSVSVTIRHPGETSEISDNHPQVPSVDVSIVTPFSLINVFSLIIYDLQSFMVIGYNSYQGVQT